MTDELNQASPPAAKEDKWTKGLIQRFFEGMLPSLTAAIVGYAGALVISPDQLYRKLFWPDPDHYLGRWSGKIAGRPAEMNITRQFFYPGGHSVHVEGTVQFNGSNNKINVSGDTDSRLVLSGRINPDQIIVLALERDVPQIRSPKERYTRLEEKKGEDAASICPAHETLDTMIKGNQCRSLGGHTYFFR